MPNASSSLAVTSERAWESPRDVGLGGSVLAKPGGTGKEMREGSQTAPKHGSACIAVSREPGWLWGGLPPAWLLGGES